jgi:hypothetical protein
MALRIAPPFGYEEVVPFVKTQKVRLPRHGEVPQFARRANALPISYSEFQLVARDYPIVFTSGDGGKSFAPVALLGLQAGENLFCAGEAWAGEVYVPAYARRHPFCMARVNVDQVERKERLICVEKASVDEEHGEALFDAEGRASPKWSALERLLSEYEADLERSREMCALLVDYGVLEAFSMQASADNDAAASPVQLGGMHRASEKSLDSLNAAQLRNLMRKGVLARIYAHLLSLGNFARLLERRARARR